MKAILYAAATTFTTRRFGATACVYRGGSCMSNLLNIRASAALLVGCILQATPQSAAMPAARRFPPPWIVAEQ
jgi:hypothetical protein